MSSRWLGASLTTVGLVAVLSILGQPVAGQAPAARQPARAAAPAARPQAAAPKGAYTPSRTADGQPDFSGVWRAWNLAKYDLEDHAASPGIPAGRGFVVDPPDGKIPYRPDMLAKRKQNFENSRSSDPWKSADPLSKCYIPGVPRATYLGFPFQILQTPKYIAVVYEWMHLRRMIYFDPAGRMKNIDFWWGDSRGHWEGNTLVVDVADLNDRTWFDSVGNFHSEQLHVVERYTMTGPDTLRYEATIEDPKTFTRPWKIAMDLQRQKEIGLLEYECHSLLDEQGIPITWERE